LDSSAQTATYHPDHIGWTGVNITDLSGVKDARKITPLASAWMT